MASRINESGLKQKLLGANKNPFENIALFSGKKEFTDEVPMSRLQILSDFINDKLGLG